MNTSLKTFVFALASVFASSSAHAQVVYHWNFNDANGTGLSSLSVSGTGSGNFGDTISGVATDGTGQLAVNNASVGNSWLSISDLNFNTVGSIYRVETKINGWNFTGNTSDSGVYIGFMEGNNTTTVTSDFNITADASNMLLRSRVGGTLYTNGGAFTLSGSNLWVRMDVAYNAPTSKNTSLYYSTDGSNWTTAFANQNFTTGSRELDDFRFRSSADMSGANEVTLDYLTVSIIPEPGTLALFGLAGAAVLAGLCRRRG